MNKMIKAALMLVGVGTVGYLGREYLTSRRLGAPMFSAQLAQLKEQDF